MSIISEIGRKHIKVRLFIYGMYALLTIGAISMIYPFLIMIAGTSKSGVDSPDAELVPNFLIEDVTFYRKNVEAFYNEQQSCMQSSYDINDKGFRHIKPRQRVNSKLVAHWNDFVKQHKLPFYAYEIAYSGYRVSKNIQPMMLRRFKAELKEEFKDSISVMNNHLGTDFVSWNNVFLRPDLYIQRRITPGTTPYSVKWREFKLKQSPEYRFYASPDGFFRTVYLKAQYTKDINIYNRTNRTNYRSWDEVVLTRRYPGKGFSDRQRKDWSEFVRSILNLYWIRADKQASPLFQAFLKAKYNGSIAFLNKLYKTKYKHFEQVPLVAVIPLEGAIISDWDSFIQGWQDPNTGKTHILPDYMIRIHSVPLMFRDFTLKKFGTLTIANSELGTAYTDIMQLDIPQRDSNQIFFKKNTTSLKKEFLSRNFTAVTEYILLQGNAIVNTVIYCGLGILFSLIINPIGAYALSRYKPKGTYKILMFLMLTMAFPPMVTSIPSFLMLREFGLLNTFAALILPGAANGYSIFLLKGFFDSLPQELYESAELDGAGEIRIFWQITMSLSKPILAVIALRAFNMAYANFMMALLICQDKKMWTLMPWLYQLQQKSCEGIVFSSLLIAAIPTFIIFILCQNVIMRGIVVPVEK
jgi:ABC-type glycerol-3-phosphate transport system permease component